MNSSLVFPKNGYLVSCDNKKERFGQQLILLVTLFSDANDRKLPLFYMIAIKKKDWIEIVLHIAFWVGVFYTMLSFTQPDIKMRINHNGTIIQEDIRYSLSSHIFVTFGFMVLLFYGNIFWVFKKAFLFKNILIRVVLPIVWFGIIFTANHYMDTLLPAPTKTDPVLLMSPPRLQDKRQVVIDTNVDRPPVPDVQVRREVSRQQSRAFIFTGNGFSNTLLFIFIIVFGLSIAYFFLKEWARAEKMHSELAAVQLDTEVKFLKSQVNPHFLFNTLNNLFSMAQKKGNDDLADGISKLSGMMRYMIYESNEEHVPLKKEIEYLENCILLNELRYAEGEARVVFKYPEQTEGILVAPMLFIPFVENAFKHGVAIGRSSEIDISIAVANKQLTFTCENTIYGVKKMDDEKSGIGLENVKRRLALLYPGRYDLSINTAGNKYIVNLGITIE
jgi:two-component system, LytTR family, sensor kinase